MQALLDELDNLIRHGIPMPVGSKILVDGGALRRLVAELRDAAPEDLRTGQRLAGERDRILTDARAQARRIVEDAQHQANARLDEQSVVQAARQKAREILQQAERSAATLRSEADQYVLNQFNLVEARLIRIVREVQAGQRALTRQAGDQKEDGPSS